MTRADDFDDILGDEGTSITIVTLIKSVSSSAYVQSSEVETVVTALVQPLTAREITFLPSAKYTTEDLKVYVSTDTTVALKDEVKYQGERYEITMAEETGAYKKLILKRKPQ